MSSDNIIHRLTSSLEGLPKMIASALTKRSDDFKTRVQAEIDSIVADFNVEKIIREAAEPLLNNALTSAIKSHFESTYGQQAIKAHIEKILKDATPAILDDNSPVEDSGTTAQEKPAPSTTDEKTQDTATVSSKAPDSTFVPPPGTMLFSDPLTLKDLETLQEKIYPIKFFTLDGFKTSLDAFNTNNPQSTDSVLILNRADAEKIQHPPFDTFFDPMTEAGRVTQGQFGHILGMEVYSDTATGQAPFITTSGFVDRPVELHHTTATNETMAEVTPS